MARRLTALATSAALILGGCGAADFGDLPKDAKERAMLCTRAGVLLIGTTRSDDKARFDRVSDKARKLANADGFYALFPEGNSDPGKVLGDEASIQSAVGSHWASTVNECFRAYGIEEEPVPALPEPPYNRAIACAAATAYDDLGTQKLNPEARIAYDAQAGYFIHKAAVQAGGAEQLVKANDDAATQFHQVLMTGTARVWAKQCRAEDPKAVKASVTLPADGPVALLVCDDALSFAEEGGLAVNANRSESARRYAAGYRKVHALLDANPAARADPKAVEAAIRNVAESGRLDQIGDACIARFGS